MLKEFHNTGITTFKHPLLRMVCEKADLKDKKLLPITKRMYSTMLAYNGIGIAAPQIGVNTRAIIAVIDTQPILMINPEIITSSGSVTSEEGCLSIPGVYGQVTRHKEIQIKYWTLEQQEVITKLENLNAIVVQHEIDHLNGILFTDKATSIKLSL